MCVRFSNASIVSSLQLIRLPLRRAALRLISSSPVVVIPKPRSRLASRFSTPSLPRQILLPALQRRWATNEAEAKREDDAVTSADAGPQEDVHNAVSPGHAAGESPQSEAEQSSVKAAADYVVRTVSSTASSIADAVGGGAKESSEGFRFRDTQRLIGEPKSTIYIGNLFFDVTENDLVKELARFGTITRCRLMRDSRGLSKGFGYVDFETIESASKAIEALNQQLFEGRRLAVQYAAYESRSIDANRQAGRERPAKPLNPPSKTLFIGNMSFEMSDRDLNNLFKGIRNVIDVRVAIDRRTGQPRGFAHADFIDVKSAMDAMKLLENKETYGRKLRLDYSYGPSGARSNRDQESGDSGEGRV